MWTRQARAHLGFDGMGLFGRLGTRHREVVFRTASPEPYATTAEWI